MITYEEQANMGMMDEAIKETIKDILNNCRTSFRKAATQSNNRGLASGLLSNKYKVGDITKGEAWKATGALIRQDAQWMKNTFDNLGLDWNNLSKQEKTFWTYASFNGGPGLAKDILQKYGSMEKVINFVKEFNADPNSDWHKMDFIQYMDNVLRVAGGRDILDIYNPWNYE